MITQPILVDLGQCLQDGFICLSTDFCLFLNGLLVIGEEHLDSRSLYLYLALINVWPTWIQSSLFLSKSGPAVDFDFSHMF
jgi:hypothetical protein